MRLPEHGQSPEAVLAHLTDAKQYDVRWDQGRLFSLVYGVSAEHTEVLGDAYKSYISTNGLGKGFIFQSLGELEDEVIGITLDLLSNPEGAGNITSGGTESIIMGTRAALQGAKAKGEVRDPELLIPQSAHPAFEKAGELMGIRVVRSALADDTTADLDALRAAITPNTIMVAGSAPNYPFGTIDPIADMAAIAKEHDLHFHTDACVGGFALPFHKKAGEPIPDFDFTIPGVDTISADIHKYGFAARGTSLILYRDRAIQKRSIFRLGTWDGGPYITPTLAGSRPGGAVAAAWAALHHLGQDGYMRVHTSLLETTRKFQAGVRESGYRVLGDPAMSLFSFTADALDVNGVADAMLERGWFLLRQPTTPPSLHLLITAMHTPIVDEFLNDLRECTATVRATGRTSEETANYAKQ